MDILIFLIIFSVLIGVWANSWGRSGLGWGVAALLFSPILTAIVLLIMGEDSDQRVEDAAQKAADIERRKEEIMKNLK